MRVTALYVAVRNRFRLSDDGAGLVEYALLVSLIALVCILAVAFLGDKTSTRYSGFGSAVDAAGK
jgi:Flp pilus assembly pilin Flp